MGNGQCLEVVETALVVVVGRGRHKLRKDAVDVYVFACHSLLLAQ